MQCLAQIEARKLYIALGKALGVDDLRSTRRWSDSAVNGVANEMVRRKTRKPAVAAAAAEIPSPVRKSWNI